VKRRVERVDRKMQRKDNEVSRDMFGLKELFSRLVGDVTNIGDDRCCVGGVDVRWLIVEDSIPTHISKLGNRGLLQFLRKRHSKRQQSQPVSCTLLSNGLEPHTGIVNISKTSSLITLKDMLRVMLLFRVYVMQW
jgi:hypothetical protein